MRNQSENDDIQQEPDNLRFGGKATVVVTSAAGTIELGLS